MWFDRHTISRLRNQYQPDENTLDDVLTRLLDGAETWRSLEEVTRGYLAARGQDNVAQVAVERQSFETGALTITSHTPVQDDLPAIVTETDAIIHHGHRYNLRFEETTFGPHDLGRITMYAADNIVGMDEVPLEEGLAAADEHMEELLERGEPLPSRPVE